MTSVVKASGFAFVPANTHITCSGTGSVYFKQPRADFIPPQSANVTTFLDVSEGLTSNITTTRGGDEARAGPVSFAVRGRSPNHANLSLGTRAAFQQNQPLSTMETANFLVVKQGSANTLALSPGSGALVTQWGPCSTGNWTLSLFIKLHTTQGFLDMPMSPENIVTTYGGIPGTGTPMVAFTSPTVLPAAQD